MSRGNPVSSVLENKCPDGMVTRGRPERNFELLTLLILPLAFVEKRKRQQSQALTSCLQCNSWSLIAGRVSSTTATPRIHSFVIIRLTLPIRFHQNRNTRILCIRTHPVTIDNFRPSTSSSHLSCVLIKAPRKKAIALPKLLILLNTRQETGLGSEALPLSISPGVTYKLSPKLFLT